MPNHIPNTIMVIGSVARPLSGASTTPMMPLVATMLHQALGVAPVVAAQPELAVAQGAVLHEPGPTPFTPTPAPFTPPPPPLPPVAPPDTVLRGLRRLALALAVVAVLALGASLAAWVAAPSTGGTEQPPAEALAAAESAAVALLSYDYRSFDADKADALTHLTGQFADDYARQMDELEEQAVADSSVVVATVADKGVVSSSDEAVTVLVFVDQRRSNDNSDGEQVDQNRLEFTMVLVDGTWKVQSGRLVGTSTSSSQLSRITFGTPLTDYRIESHLRFDSAVDAGRWVAFGLDLAPAGTVPWSIATLRNGSTATNGLTE